MPPIYQRYGLRQGDDDEQHWYPVAVPISLRLAMRGIILSALAWSSGHQREAADALQISPRVLDYMMTTYGIPRSMAVFRKRVSRGKDKIGIAARQRAARKRALKG